MHVQPVQQTARLDHGQHAEQCIVSFVVVLGDHVIGQALLFNHPATQGKPQLGANGQGLLAQLVQTGLFQRQLIAHMRMPERIQRTVWIENYPAVGTHRTVDEW